MNKKIYLVRHAETVANNANIFAKDDDPLSITGLQGIIKNKNFLMSIKPDFVYSSSLLRSIDTAKQVFNSVDIVKNAIFDEVRLPQRLLGTHVDDYQLSDLRLMLINDKYNLQSKSIEDGECPSDALSRANLALSLLKVQKCLRPMIFTHGKFIRFILLAIYLNNGGTLEDEIKSILDRKIENLETIEIDYIEETGSFIVK